MGAETSIIIDASFQDRFTVQARVGNDTIPLVQAGDTPAGKNPLQHFFLSLGSCVAAVANLIIQQENLAIRSLKLTARGDLAAQANQLAESRGGRPAFSGLEVVADIDADISAEDKAAFLTEVDATLRTLFNLTAYKQHLA